MSNLGVPVHRFGEALLADETRGHLFPLPETFAQHWLLYLNITAPYPAPAVPTDHTGNLMFSIVFISTVGLALVIVSVKFLEHRRNLKNGPSYAALEPSSGSEDVGNVGTVGTVAGAVDTNGIDARFAHLLNSSSSDNMSDNETRYSVTNKTGLSVSPVLQEIAAASPSQRNDDLRISGSPSPRKNLGASPTSTSPSVFSHAHTDDLLLSSAGDSGIEPDARPNADPSPPLLNPSPPLEEVITIPPPLHSVQSNKKED